MKKNKLLFAVLIIFSLLVSSCGNTQSPAPSPDLEDQEVVEEENANDGTVESNLNLLTEYDWKETKDGYQKTTSNEECDGIYTVTAKDNTVSLKISFDYGSDNKEMIKMFKDDPDIAKEVASQWIEEVSGVTGIYSGDAKYEMFIGEKNIASGTLTFDEAFQIAESIE